MHCKDLSAWKHTHDFSGEFAAAERNTRRVLLLTLIMMVVEIFGGLKFGSMALFADGWHMGTHAAAFAIASLAYWFSRRNANNERFSFGTGKIGVLAAFTSAVILGGIALYMAGESVLRLFTPAPIAFNQAIPIAIAGLFVNIGCAFMLKHGAYEHKGYDNHEPHHQDHDLNLKASFLHVIADALTSVFAIAALVLGKYFGWRWLDPTMGILGSIVIAQWAFTLMRDTHAILLDCEPASCDLRSEIRKSIEGCDDTLITDLHIWQVDTNKFSAIISLVTHHPRPPQFYKTLLGQHEELIHVTVEVNEYSEA